MKQWQIIKTILYTLAGIAVLIFHDSIMDFVGYIVGAVIVAYSVDVLIVSVIKKTYIGENLFLFGGLIHLFIGIIIFIVSDDLVKICLVWAVWSIIREGKELSESIHRLASKKPSLINAIESVVIIYMSFSMILEPNSHHAHLHVVLLGIELILEVAFPIANRLIDGFIEKRNARKEDKSQDEEELLSA
ncbi:MAG: hypothetical protein IJ800_06560 [Clostridia bacterium]|nr:hypothetical protein [Clostridia bacterium]